MEEETRAETTGLVVQLGACPAELQDLRWFKVESDVLDYLDRKVSKYVAGHLESR